MTRARNIAGFSTITTTPSPVHVGPIGVLTATRIDGEFNQVDLATRNITAAGIAATNLQVSGITTGLNVSGIITAQNGINFNGTSTGLNVSGVGTIATLSVTGNATVGGVLTYEDVTRVDSVGVVTARGLSIFGNTTGLNVASGISTFQAVTGTTGTFTGDVDIASSLVHTGDTDTKLTFTTDNIALITGGTTRVNITSSGNLEMPNDNDYIKIGAGGDLQLVHTGGSSNIVNNTGALQIQSDIIRFDNASGTERLRTTSAGLILIGTTADVAGGATNSKLQIRSTSYDASLAIVANRTNAGGGNLSFAKSRAASQGDATVVQSGDTLGSIVWYGADGTDINTGAAQLDAQVDGTPGSNDMPGRLVFRTTADGASSSTERMRLASNGALSINYAGTGDNTLHIGCTSNAGGIIIKAPGDHYANMVIDSNRSGANNGIFNLAGRWNGNDVAYMSFTTGTDTTNKDDGYIRMYTRTSGSSLTERVRITQDGYVQIGQSLGTNSVGGQSVTGQDFDPVFKIYNNVASKWLMQLRNDNSTAPNGIFMRAGNSNSNYTMYLTGGDEHVKHLIVRGDGRTGIGTDNPDERLEVNGNAKFTPDNGDVGGPTMGVFPLGDITLASNASASLALGSRFNGIVIVSGNQNDTAAAIFALGSASAYSSDSATRLHFQTHNAANTTDLTITSPSHGGTNQFQLNQTGSVTKTYKVIAFGIKG